MHAEDVITAVLRTNRHHATHLPDALLQHATPADEVARDVADLEALVEARDVVDVEGVQEGTEFDARRRVRLDRVLVDVRVPRHADARERDARHRAAHETVGELLPGCVAAGLEADQRGTVLGRRAVHVRTRRDVRTHVVLEVEVVAPVVRQIAIAVDDGLQPVVHVASVLVVLDVYLVGPREGVRQPRERDDGDLQD
eukprot:528345-Rhodomonas_salina.1